MLTNGHGDGRPPISGSEYLREETYSATRLPVERASSDALRAFVKSEIDTWGAVVRKAGIAATQ